MARRKQIDKGTVANVLSKSLRRCCLCFALEQDFREKMGQIAHVDQIPLNGAEDNLVFLCLEHHALYDSKTRVHKNYTREELLEARRKLYQHIAAMNTLSAEHDRLKDQWKLILEQMDALHRETHAAIQAQNLVRIEANQQQLERLVSRISQIGYRQFAREKDFFRV